MSLTSPVAAIKEKFTLEDLKAALEEEGDDDAQTDDDEDAQLPPNVTSAFGAPRLRAKEGKKIDGLRRILQLAQNEAVGDATQCSVCLDEPEVRVPLFLLNID